MKRILFFSAIWVASMGAVAADLNLSDSPLEIPQGVAPNIVVIMDDSGSMDWEIITRGYDNGGLFWDNQNFNSGVKSDSEIFHKRHWNGLGGKCGIGNTPFNWGYAYGTEFQSNTYKDGTGNGCYAADEKSWRFRNYNFNPLYYNPNRTYDPWPGLSDYTNTNYPDGVPYSELAAEFKTDNGLGSLPDYLIGFDNPTNPAEWLDLTVNNTQSAAAAGQRITGTNGFSYFTWVDTGVIGLFENSDTVTEVMVSSLGDAKKENFQNWFNFYRSRALSVKASLHFVLEDMITARVGYTTINSTANNFAVAGMNVSPTAVGGNKEQLLHNIDLMTPGNGTPLRTALKGVGEYFSASATSDNRFDAGATPYLPSDQGGTCQQNYSILFTDGYWNGSTSPSVGNQDADDVANKFDGWWFADDYSNTLADVAMKYYKNDLMPTYDDEVPITEDDRNLSNGAFSAGQETMHQNMKTYTVAFGLSWLGDFVPSDTSIWPDPTLSNDAKLFDLYHTAFNGRGSFYAANDYQTLTTRLKESFTKILANQSGAAGVSFNSQELKTGTYIFRAFYNPATFDGDLVAIEFDQDGQPLLDTPVWSASEQLANVISDGVRLIVSYDPVDDIGILFDYGLSDVPKTPGGLNKAQKVYFQQEKPASKAVVDPDVEPVGYALERVAYLHGDQSNEGTRFDNGELRERAGLLGDFANSTPRYVGIPQGVKRDFEPYPVDPYPIPDGYPVADIGKDLYSTFKQTYLDRDQLVYAGANDGMLHGFDAVTGREKFAYVPNIVMDDLYQYTLPGYIHEMSVDGSPGINDVFINDGRVAIERWRTILMGGLRAGGKGYYALDITDPSTFNADDMLANVLWEFTAGNDNRLGFTYSTANMVMSNAVNTSSGNQRWISLFGNGYNQSNTYGESALFALFLDQGGDLAWNRTNPHAGPNASSDDWMVMQTGVGFASGITYPNGLGVPRAVDTDGNGTVDYVYAGDLTGNLYRFDLTSADPADWRMTQILFKASYTNPNTSVVTPQPITVQPIVQFNEALGGYNVIVSTGSWMTNEDITSTNVQSLYSVWDVNPAASMTKVVQSELVRQSFTNVEEPYLGYSYRTLSALPVNYKSTTTGNPKGRTMGWKINFDMCGATGSPCPEYPGERAIRNLLVKDGVLFGVTILPSSNAYCANSPGGYLFSLNAQTGGLVQERPAFDLNGDGEFDILDISDDGDKVIEDDEVPAAIRIEDGLPSDIAVIDGGANAGSKVCYQTSTGELVCTNTNVDSKFPEGRLSWKELSD